MKTILLSSDRHKVLQAFREHLLSTRGLSAATCVKQAFFAGAFLDWWVRRGRHKCSAEPLTAEVLLHYVLRSSRRHSPGRLQALATALRSFGRFLQLRGWVKHDLTSALPRVASPRRSRLPDYLQPEQLRALLASIPTSTVAGRRNYAILICLARLGLRAGEVATLSLDQVRWRAGVLQLGGGKGRRERQLPLSREVGQAIAAYLRARPQPPGSRRVFGALHNGHPLSPTAIYQVAKLAMQRAGIQTPRPGAHLLRRTLASHLVQAGVSLKAVADLLGHRALNSTRSYAAVNHAMLQEVARPWPKEVQP